MELTQDEYKRYGRHLILPEIGEKGQLKLKSARVLIVGAGGLGSPAAIYLTAAGVGTLGLVDFDRVDFSNLQRQVLYSTADVGKSKVVSAKEQLFRMNPNVKVVTHETAFSAQNALDILKGYDLVIDGTDNFTARYLINDSCVMSGKPFVYGGIFRFEGQCSVFGFKDGPCYRCFFSEPPAAGEVPSCAEAGVLGILPGIIGLLEANEAVKIICGIGETLKGRLLIFDALSTQFREIRIHKDPACPMCGPNRKIKTLIEYEQACAPAPRPGNVIPEMTVQEVKKLLDERPGDIYLLDVREPREWKIAHIEGAVLKPMSTFDKDYQDIPKDKKIIAYCHVGGRSAQAVKFLRSKGYTDIFNVRGGIAAWSEFIDPAIPTY